MGWLIAVIALACALMLMMVVKAIVLLGRGIVLLGVALLRGLAGMLK